MLAKFAYGLCHPQQQEKAAQFWRDLREEQEHRRAQKYRHGRSRQTGGGAAKWPWATAFLSPTRHCRRRRKSVAEAAAGASLLFPFFAWMVFPGEQWEFPTTSSSITSVTRIPGRWGKKMEEEEEKKVEWEMCPLPLPVLVGSWVPESVLASILRKEQRRSGNRDPFLHFLKLKPFMDERWCLKCTQCSRKLVSMGIWIKKNSEDQKFA
jgi:hypothetical protein